MNSCAIDSMMEQTMTALDLLMTPVAPARAPNRRTGRMLAFAVVVGIAAAAGLAARSPEGVDGATEISSLPPTGAGKEAAPQALVDHSSVDWDKVPVEPDPSQLSVAVYGD
jgi:hypothetical protein